MNGETRAVIVGAGMAGLASAAASAKHFDKVLLIERDELPDSARHRPGTPQSRHLHGLRAGGLKALEDLFPGLDSELAVSGAVRMRAGLDMNIESPGSEQMPRRDLGWHTFSISRPLLEATIRRRVRALQNVEFVDNCRAERLFGEAGDVRGVVCSRPGAATQALEADLVIDASGRGKLTLDFLTEVGAPLPDATVIGVDLAYATQIFETPENEPERFWKGVQTAPAFGSGRAAMLAPLEGGRRIITLVGRHGDYPEADWEGYLRFAQRLATPTILEIIEGSKPLDEVRAFRFPESHRRRFEGLEAPPTGLIVIGDALCRFNPVHGQGMAVAFQEASALDVLLSDLRPGSPSAWRDFGLSYFRRMAELIETPWEMAAINDFLFPQTTGERPDDLPTKLYFGAALNKLAIRDPDVHRLTQQVTHLLTPLTVYQQPDFLNRVLAVAAEV